MIKSKKEKNEAIKQARPRRMPFIGKQGELSGGKRFVSMRVKFVGMLAITGVTVLVAALIAIPLTLQVFRSVYMTPSHADERLDRYMSRFAAYVAEENVCSDDATAVVRWTRLHRSVYLTVFNDDDPNFGAAGGKLWPDGSTPDMAPFFDPIISSDSRFNFEAGENGKVYSVLFADGVHPVAVVDYSFSIATDAIIIGGALLAVFSFFIAMMIYYHLQTRAIVTLSREVEAVSGGALEAKIVAERNDEIGRLAEDVDTMRNTILEKMAEKEKAWQANSDLLTSMTHDIRTPLTTLMGYMELLSGDHGNLTEEQREYIRICTQKAEQIKGLSDELFLYFWAYNRAETEPNADLDEYEARLLMEQIIGEYIPSMESEGIHIDMDLSAVPADQMIYVRLDCLRRITDNLFDNIRKYADRSIAVTITAGYSREEVTVCFANRIGEPNEHTSSTKIGVKTCVNMMEFMRGRFESQVEDGMYTSLLTFAVANSSFQA